MSHGEIFFLMEEIKDIRKIVGGRAVKTDAKNYKQVRSIEEDLEELKKEFQEMRKEIADWRAEKAEKEKKNQQDVNVLADTLKNSSAALEAKLNEIPA